MIYLRYLVLMGICMTMSYGHIYGIINTQTVTTIKKTEAKNALKTKKEELQEKIDQYADSIRLGNEELQKSIKLLKAVIEVKKDALISIERLEHQTKTTKKEIK